jgi:hypothetical protein
VPRQNRITPFGDIVAVAERGTFMGNRGHLHDSQGHIQRSWQVKRWLICVLEFRGRRRTVMAPHSYTELFFLDEATALAAGHRPCAECRHARFIDFCAAWNIAYPGAGNSQRPRADDMDSRLHGERVKADRSKQFFAASLGDLPDGVLVTLQTDAAQAYLVWKKKLLAWSPAGYQHHRPAHKNEAVRVLTPKSIVAVIRAGYVPEIHPSAIALS